jgi:acetyl esterase/lipase
VKAILFWVVRIFLRPFLAPWIPLGLQRAWSDMVLFTTLRPRGTISTALDMDGVPALHLKTPTTKPGKVIFYLHGGAYILGRPASYRNFAAQIGHAAGAEAYVPDYRLAPEHRYPAALDDALKAYRWLLKGRSAEDIVLVGDSAGGGLALATAVAIRDGGLPLPRRIALISPWVDLTLSGDSIRTHAARDPMLRRSWIAMGADAYRGSEPASQPGCSPLFAKLSGLPPILIQVGTEEILLSDSERLVQRAESAGVEVKLSRYQGLWHDFQLHAGLLAESDTAIAELGTFLRG